MKRLALVKLAKRKENVFRAFDILGREIQLEGKETVVIKVLLPGFKEIYANTHVDTVEAVISFLQRFPSIKKIVVAEGSSGAYYRRNTKDVFRRFKFSHLEEGGKVELMDLDDIPHTEEVPVTLYDGTPSTVRICQPPGDYTISVAPPKTHDLLILSLGMVNMIGFVHPEDKLKIYGLKPEEGSKRSLYSPPLFSKVLRVAHKNLAELISRVHPDLSYIDGLYGMEGKGPLKGSPVFHGFAIASSDYVAVDSLGAYVMGFQPDEIGYIHYAARKGLGSTDYTTAVGERLDYVKFPYRAHPNLESQRKWRETPHGR
ncbi:MAG TPA: DUF362 domain-containing protein [Candidatus Aminicenantes bacterium]|nr:DUF362 domain-containing protein [Candidatus Aminicenantes bacterium]HPB56553.1 DUF362 domain-containing protein [Candidatus Aminicenantes bacterium]HPS99698.1 DUF362 domain-containing protein [Candidatus Aminicenantes bacterium]